MNCTTCYIAKDRVHVKINPKSTVLNMNCYYVTVVDCIKVAPRKFNTTAAVNLSNSTSISTLPCTDHKLRKILYNSQASVGDSDRQYTIILFISNMFLLIILNYLNDRGRGAIICCRILAPPHATPPPSPNATILIYRSDRERVHHYLL